MSEESFKGGIHATMGALLVVMAAYNAMRLCGPTRTRRNMLNVAFYAPAAVYEFSQARHHWSQSCSRSRVR